MSHQHASMIDFIWEVAEFLTCMPKTASHDAIVNLLVASYEQAISSNDRVADAFGTYFSPVVSVVSGRSD